MPRRRKRAKVALAPRATPQQARAQRTHDLILDAAVSLLEETGAEGLTTRRVAERAGVLVRSVYRYYPNRQAIVLALGRRVIDAQRLTLGDWSGLGDLRIPWREAIQQTLWRLVAEGGGVPGAVAIRRAMRSSPELRAVDESTDREIAKELTALLGVRKPDLPEAHRSMVAYCVVTTTTDLLDRAALDMTEDPVALIRELGRILESYLASYLD